MYLNKRLLEAMRRYDRRLYMKWNNVDHYWEVWIKMPWGDRLVTPIVETIYGGTDMTFVPPDNRIMHWLYGADSLRKDLPLSWRFRKDHTIKLREKRKWDKYKVQYKNFCLDNYNILNSELNKMEFAQLGDPHYVPPEHKSRISDRIMYRSKIDSFGSD